MTFSIITPNFRANRWLPLCIQSVADQTAAASSGILDDGFFGFEP